MNIIAQLPTKKSNPSFTAFYCVEPPPPINGGKICQSWLHGIFCTVSCWPSYAFVELPPPFYSCGKLGFWDPPRGNPFRFPACSRKHTLLFHFNILIFSHSLGFFNISLYISFQFASYTVGSPYISFKLYSIHISLYMYVYQYFTLNYKQNIICIIFVLFPPRTFVINIVTVPEY